MHLLLEQYRKVARSDTLVSLAMLAYIILEQSLHTSLKEGCIWLLIKLLSAL